MAYCIEGARVLTEEGLVETAVSIEDGVIRGFETSAAKRIDGRGLILAPAMVDIHGDAFEREMMPRPGVFVPLVGAILAVDQLLAANGIATAYHALTLSWEPGLRSVAQGEAFVDALNTLRPRLRVDHRVQLRWETFAFEAEPLIQRCLEDGPMPSLAFNDHTSMSMRDRSIPIQNRRFEHDPDYETTALDDPNLPDLLAGNARRSGLSPQDYVQRLGEIWARRPDVPAAITRMAEAAGKAGAPMLSHDDTQIVTRDFYRGKGASVAEFPMTHEVTKAARGAGDAIVFGAPNAMRGGSHIGSPAAGEMVLNGLCDALASDYHYPAMLGAITRLCQTDGAAFEDVWPVVSSGPARASGLTDRGRIAPGMRADLVLLDWPKTATPPRVVKTFSGGRLAFAGADLMA